MANATIINWVSIIAYGNIVCIGENTRERTFISFRMRAAYRMAINPSRRVSIQSANATPLSAMFFVSVPPRCFRLSRDSSIIWWL